MRYLVKVKFSVDELEQIKFKGLLVFNEEQALDELKRLEKRDPQAYGRYCHYEFTRIKCPNGEKVSYRLFTDASSNGCPPVAKIERWIKDEFAHT